MYSCPGCGSQMTFDIAGQQMKCGHCDRTMSIREADEKEAREAHGSIAVDLYSCPVCGAEIRAMNTAAAAFCSYCGSSVMLDRKDTEIDPPDTIAPFQITREQCFQKYKNILDKSFCVDHRLKKNLSPESFRGIYVPYHMYKAGVQGETVLKGVRTQGNTTYYYDTTVSLNHQYEGILHDASREVPDNISEQISRTRRNAFRRFSPAYLSGFYADVPDTNPDAYLSYAKAEAIRRGLDDTMAGIKGQIHYSAGEVQGKLMNVAHAEHTGETLIPMWFMSVKSKKRVLYAVQNGVTGEMWADRPMDISRFAWLTAILAAALFAILCLLPNPLRPEMAMMVAMLLALGGQYAVNKRRRKAFEREAGAEVPTPGSDNTKTEMNKLAALVKLAAKQGKGLVSRNGGAIWAAIAIVLGVTIMGRTENIKIYKYASVAMAAVMLYLVVGTGERRSKLPAGSLVAMLAVVAGAAIMILDPFHSSDLAVYVITAVITLAVVWESLDLLKVHNRSCSNPMPQFGSHTGGEDRA